jgi:hypothetical protein
MIITTASGKSFNTESDLSAPERHILQKLMLWEGMVKTVQEFKDRTDEALEKGWNNSGPVRAGTALLDIVKDLEQKVKNRLG